MTSDGSVRRLHALVERLQADATQGGIAGAAIVVARQDAVLLDATAGVRDVTTGDALQRDALWRIFSMTKPIVTACAMALAEQGRLRLDQPVADFIPAFGRQSVATPDGDRPVATLATVQDLMRHTAGLAYGYAGGDSPAHRALIADGFLAEDLPLAAYVERLAALPLEFQPGTTWHYSHATEVLGRVLEVVTDQVLEEALRSLVLDPLGMHATGFTVRAADRARIAEPLPRSPGERPGFFDPCVPRRLQSAGGGLVSTSADYSRFLRMLLGRGTLDGERFLSPASVALMTSDHLGTALRRAAYYPPGPGYGFGLGVAVRTEAGLAASPGSVGDYFWSGVGGTYFWVDPQLGFFALLMMQTPSIAQRQHYRGLVRNMVYAAL